MKEYKRKASAKSASIGHKIFEMRKKEGVTREQFARKLGVHPVTLFQWEKGYNLIGVCKFFEACEKLGVSADYFFNE